MTGSRIALNPSDISSALNDLSGWTYADNRLEKTFKFSGFREAMSFLMRIAFEAEELDHHPEIWNVYSTVRLRLTTHDADNRVTNLDLDLARRVNMLAWT